MSDDHPLVSIDGRVFLQRIDRELAHVDVGRDETRALLRDLRSRIIGLEGDLWAADAGMGLDACVIGALRESARRVFGANCAFADDDLALLTELARRAVAAGLIDGLHKSVLANIAKVSPTDGAPANSPKVRTP